METDELGIYLQRIDPDRNMARFYHLFALTDLFGGIVAVRRWGRIVRSGRQITWRCASAAEATMQLKQFANLKRRRGYRDVCTAEPVETNATRCRGG
ncbi:WGR domain-containing protein [Rhizobium sp. 9140]|uniref:WGR domain-containing protein n=1 Tax=Rhizobium sp. 9140 TaxID=1761900 RepID=UPI00079329E1|nr:WGR domain-containing protein [Rhizobium sp. 9140]CZT38063.1 WGR domain-containing protein, predicted DNA-binding domain in MolR [Rhizobium sp. 9140]